jgi:hypothetical protein
VDYPLTMRHRDGTVTEVLYNASVYRDGGGKVLGVFAAARDVTEQNLAETELAQQRLNELDRMAELERFQRLTVGRELKMIELKKENEYLRKFGLADGGDLGGAYVARRTRSNGPVPNDLPVPGRGSLGDGG